MRSLLVLILIAIGFTGSILSRHLGLLTYVWFSLFRPLEWVWWNLAPYRLSLVSGLLLLVPCLLTGILPNVTHPLSILSWLMLGLTVLAEATTFLNLDWAWTQVDQFARLIVVSCLAVTLLNTRARFSQFVAVLAGSFAFFSAKAGIVALVSGGIYFGDGQAGAFVDSNGYALAINMAIPLMIASGTVLQLDLPGLRRTLPYIKKGFWVAVPLSVFTVIATNSRGGLLALIVLAFAFAMLQRRPFTWTFGLILTGALVFQVAPMPDGYVERIETIRTYERVGEGSALSRLHFWHVALVMVEDNPLGVGLRNYDAAYDRYDDSGGLYGGGRSVHSSHLQVLSELGYAGLALWIAIFAYAITVCLRIRFAAVKHTGLTDEERKFYVTMSTAFAASMCAFVVGGAFIAAASNDLTWLMFGATAALQRLFQKQAARPAHVAAPAPAVRAAPVMPPPRRKAIA